MPRSVLARPGLWLLGLLALSIPLAAALPRLTIRTDGQALYPAGSAAIESTRVNRELFRDPEAVIALVTPRTATEGIFTPAGLAYVKTLTERIRTVSGVRSDGVVSLATILEVTASTESIRLARFLDPLPAGAAECRRLRERLREEALYEGLLYGADGRSAALVVPLAPDGSRTRAVHHLRAAVDALADPGFRVRLTGPVVAEALLGEQVLADLTRLVPIVVVVIGLTLFLCLRSAAGALIPLLEAGFVLVWTFGAMALCRVPLTLVTSVLPVLLMAMAITDVIHLLERFQAHMGAGMSREAALARTWSEVGPPVVRTSLTTALGFLAFTTASVPAMRDFGVFAGVGLVLAMVFSFTLVPAVLLLLPEGWLRRTAESAGGRARGVERWAGARPGAAALVGLLLLAASSGGLPSLEVQDAWIQNFNPGSDLVEAEGLFNRQYRGSYRLDVTIGSPEEGYFRRAGGLRVVDSLQRVLAALPDVGGTQSLADWARAGLRGVDAARPLETLGDEGLAQLFLMLEMSGNHEALDRLITPSGREARIPCYVRGADYRKAVRLLERTRAMGARLAATSPLRLRATGDLAVATEVVRATVANQVRSVAMTLAGLLLFLAFSFRSLKVAGMLLLPVAATTVIVFGGMGYSGIALGVATSMFAALAEGEGVDFSIHLVSRYRELRRGRAAPAALADTLDSVGAAIRWNGLALVAGCLILCLSALRPVRALGALLAAGMAVSYLTAFLLLPALLLRLAPPGPRRGRRRPAGSETAAVLLGLVLMAGAPRLAWAEKRSDADEPEARRLMEQIEQAQRAGHRLFSMDIALTIAGTHHSERRMLGVARAEPATTRLLYVMTTPRFFRGSTLLIHDAVNPGRPDRMWVCLPSLGAFREVEAGSLRLLVPGTGLTYEDSRGWISADKYSFKMLEPGKDEATIEARPRSDSLMQTLGASRLLIRVNPGLNVVTGVVFFDPAGNLAKTYEASDFVELGGRWYPTQVKTHQRVQLLDATICYRYRALEPPPPADLFRADLRDFGFLDRLLAWEAGAGFGAEFPDSVGAR